MPLQERDEMGFMKFLNRMGYWYCLAVGKIHGDEPPSEDPEIIKRKIEILQGQNKPITKDSLKQTRIQE